MMTKAKKGRKKSKAAIWKKVLLMLAGLLIGINVYLLNARGVGQNQLPMPFGYGIANVLSGSMEPTFSVGTLLGVKETQDVQVGDIVVYQSGQQLVVHRVIKIEGKQITTQGDANQTPDEPFAGENVKGVVIAQVPYLGTLMSMLKTPTGLLVLLILAFLLIESSFWKQRAEDTQEQEAIKAEIRRLQKELQSDQDEEKSNRT